MESNAFILLYSHHLFHCLSALTRKCGKEDNTNITLLPPDVFKVRNIEAGLMSGEGDELVDLI